MKIETPDDELMVLAAFRYSLGRRSYIVGTCADWLRANWLQLLAGTRLMIRSEILDAVTKGIAGDEQDVKTWLSLVEWIELEGGPSDPND